MLVNVDQAVTASVMAKRVVRGNATDGGRPLSGGMIARHPAV